MFYITVIIRLKIFVRAKPIRFDFRIWMLCSCSIYSYAMRIYSGNSSNIETLLLDLELWCSFYPVFKIKKNMNVSFTTLCHDIECFLGQGYDYSNHQRKSDQSDG